MADDASTSADAASEASGDPPAAEDDRVYLVPYGLWREAHESIELEGLRGTPYMVTPVQAPTYHMKIINMFNSDQVFNLQRDIVEEGIDVSHRSYALIASDVCAQALKWYNESQETKEKNSLIDGSIDVYPLALRVSVTRERSTLTLKITRKDNNVEIHKRSSKIFAADSNPVRIWDFSGQINLILMNEWNSLPQSNQQTDQEILLHVHVLEPITKPDSKKDEIISTQNKTNGFFYENGSNQINDSDLFNGTFKQIGSGLIGMENLGNTCYMNSALQCLVHTSKLVDYFLGDFTKEINLYNTLGTKGELALAFGDLLRRVWSQDKSPVAPRHFKSKISRFAPQFRGYSQHDSQELLAFLLDGLHEDLNRVREKPYFEAKDSEDRPDADVAEDHWSNHLARNNSVIVDFCQGQYKSTLVCPVCNKVSVTFDPFMYLSLPIPSLSTRSITVSLFGTGPPAQHTITVPKSADLKIFIHSLSTACSLNDDETLLLASVYNNRIIGYLENPSDSISIIRDGDRIVAYRMQKDNKENSNSPVLVFVHQKLETIIGRVTRWKQFGAPLISRVPQTLTGTTIRTAYLKTLNPFLLPDQSDPAICHSTEEEETSLQFYLTDERGQAQLSKLEQNDEIIHIGITQKRVYVLVSWHEKELGRYEFGLMCNLPEVYKSNGIFSRRPQESISLYSCLEAFLTEEPLGIEDMWYCPSCKEHRQALKKLDLWRLPEVLIIHLKRFSYCRFIKHKLDTSIDFPTHDFDLSKYISHSANTDTDIISRRYRLYAISNHYGNMGGGHYTAHAYHEGENKWYNFDDRRVSSISEESVKTSAAYVLFYRRI
ncbi:hypothetical protein LUZ60_005170 [Juncus effusus]|nr:hypothetical protein LUZ60_005170 [Juncus effusus]